jgi:hypothetical protein
METTKRKLLCSKCLTKIRAYEAEEKRIQRAKVAAQQVAGNNKIKK